MLLASNKSLFLIAPFYNYYDKALVGRVLKLEALNEWEPSNKSPDLPSGYSKILLSVTIFLFIYFFKFLYHDMTKIKVD